MTMVTHTAGPWRLNAGDETQVMAGGLYVARASCGGTTGTNLHTAEANARLIAAAPDILALVTQYRDDLRHPPTADSITRRLAAIDAVLAKVMGDA